MCENCQFCKCYNIGGLEVRLFIHYNDKQQPVLMEYFDERNKSKTYSYTFEPNALIKEINFVNK